MALSKEDKHDVKTHMGKALANKVSKVTRDFGKGKVLYKSKGYDAAESAWNAKNEKNLKTQAKAEKMTRSILG